MGFAVGRHLLLCGLIVVTFLNQRISIVIMIDYRVIDTGGSPESRWRLFLMGEVVPGKMIFIIIPA